MEIIPGLTISVDMIVNLMTEISMGLLCILSLVMVQQERMMDKVVSYSIGGNLKMLVWGFCAFCTLITVIVIVV